MSATVCAASAAALVACAVLLWLVSLRLRDVSIVDVFWGPGFVLVAAIALALSPPPAGRSQLLALLTAAWGLRLAVHLGRRWWGHGGGAPGSREDRRYRAMRERHGARFGKVSLATVFLAQAALAWVVSLPLQAAAGTTRPLGALAAAGVALFAVGLAFEAVGDAQLSRFLAEPASPGRVMDRGLWRYTRHPNYFGDFLVWWGLGAAAAEGAGPWVLVGPALMSFLLLRVSGVTLLEQSIGSRRPGYAAYARRTSAFFPWWPRRA